MNIDWTHVATGVIGFAIGLILKTLLEFNLAKIVVKRLYWIPVRFIFRHNPHRISGNWQQVWDFSSPSSHSDIIDRHSYTVIRQLGNYCYCEFYSKNVKYYLFGTMSDNYIIGNWGDCKDPLGYFGTFELRIINSKLMEGKWIGHSKRTQDINGDKWNWTKSN